MSRVKIGYTCSFTHPEDGRKIEGVYRGRRRVEVLNKLQRSVQKDGSINYVQTTTTYTVPKAIAIIRDGVK